ncbi:AlpA family transcriptional regulator [Nevskia sp.]|uniref:helix-turn-helix transcriptional regulator n=1 Tax=Nevskia sp. TaxID=1929292 RepID=UPI0025E99597|nr:AlpA family phage regulatory protein [Nevskia sp.]
MSLFPPILPGPLPPDERLIRVHEVMRITAMSRSTIYRKMKEGSFPEAVHVSQRFTAWRLSVVREWLHNLCAKQP